MHACPEKLGVLLRILLERKRAHLPAVLPVPQVADVLGAPGVLIRKLPDEIIEPTPVQQRGQITALRRLPLCS